MERGEASSLFGVPRDDTFEGILGNVEQTMFGEPLYRTREEKAANLLYFLEKDHPFTDGNKRIGSFLFLLYRIPPPPVGGRGRRGGRGRGDTVLRPGCHRSHVEGT